MKSSYYSAGNNSGKFRHKYGGACNKFRLEWVQSYIQHYDWRRHDASHKRMYRPATFCRKAVQRLGKSCISKGRGDSSRSTAVWSEILYFWFYSEKKQIEENNVAVRFFVSSRAGVNTSLSGPPMSSSILFRLYI